MTIEIQTIIPRRSRDLGPFLDVADVVYGDDPAWIPPLRLDMERRLLPKHNPFFQHAEVALFVARKGGALVGRISAHIDREYTARHDAHTGFFGFFDTIDDERVARALLECAERWLRAREMRQILGPMSFSFYDEVGVQTQGFEASPMLFMPHHRPYQSRLIEASGFTQIKELLAWQADPNLAVAPRAARARAELAKLEEVRIRGLRADHLEEDLDIGVKILNESFSDHWGAVPMTRAEAAKAISDLRSLVNLDLTLVAEVRGEPVAIALALPNYNEVIRDLGGRLFPFGLLRLLWRLRYRKPTTLRVPIFGLKREYRRSRRYRWLATAMAAELLARVNALGMTEAELGWTLSDNAGIAAIIQSLGARVSKKYAVYQKSLTEAEQANVPLPEPIRLPLPAARRERHAYRTPRSQRAR